MENNRVSIPITNTFTDVYSALNVAVGTKLAIQNQGPDEIQVCISSSATNNAGYVLQQFEYLTVPAGALGCFVKSKDNPLGLISAQLGGFNIPNAPIDLRVYDGLKGLTVQSFVEANSKNGTQFEYSYSTDTLAVAANLDMVMTIGSKPVLIKSRQVNYTGSENLINVYKNPVFSGGTPIQIFNVNTASSNLSLSTAKLSPTITSIGTQSASTVRSYGTPDQGGRVFGTFALQGLERVLAPNTSYLLRITNASADSIKCAVYVSFYEGELSSEN